MRRDRASGECATKRIDHTQGEKPMSMNTPSGNKPQQPGKPMSAPTPGKPTTPPPGKPGPGQPAAKPVKK